MQQIGGRTAFTMSRQAGTLMRSSTSKIINAQSGPITRLSATRTLSTTARRRAGVPNDPWAKRDAWRHHPVFGKWKQISQMFPGLGIAIVAFGAYVAWDNMTAKVDHGHGHH